MNLIVWRGINYVLLRAAVTDSASSCDFPSSSSLSNGHDFESFGNASESVVTWFLTIFALKKASIIINPIMAIKSSTNTIMSS